MYLETFQRIREELLGRFAAMRAEPPVRKALGIGAAGDKTFPVDRIAEDIILAALESSGLALSVFSEECGIRDINGGGKKVLIDPVDGSKNAISGIPFYCSSIAVCDGDTIGSVSTAYVLNLISGEEFYAEKGKGAFLNGKGISAQKGDEFYLIAYEAQAPGRDIVRILPLLARSHKTRCLGATALDLAYLGCGGVSVFVSPSASRSFDFAGGWLLSREAGGIFTDIEGNPIEDVEIGLNRSVSLLASGNQRLHEKALRILKSMS